MAPAPTCYVIHDKNADLTGRYIYTENIPWDTVNRQYISGKSKIEYKRVKDYNDAILWFKQKSATFNLMDVKRVISNVNEGKKASLISSELKHTPAESVSSLFNFVNERPGVSAADLVGKKAIKHSSKKSNLLEESKKLLKKYKINNIASSNLSSQRSSGEIKEFNAALCSDLKLPQCLCKTITMQKEQLFSDYALKNSKINMTGFASETLTILEECIKTQFEKTIQDEKELAKIMKICNYDGYQNTIAEFERACIFYNCLTKMLNDCTAKYKLPGYRTVSADKLMAKYNITDENIGLNWSPHFFFSDGGARPSYGGKGAFATVHLEFEKKASSEQMHPVNNKLNINVGYNLPLNKSTLEGQGIRIIRVDKNERNDSEKRDITNSSYDEKKMLPFIYNTETPKVTCYGNGFKSTSNNRMEIFGLIATCLVMKKIGATRAFYLTDSKYVLQLLHLWIPNSWLDKKYLAPSELTEKTIDGDKKNKDLILMLLIVLKDLEIVPLHVQGHTGFKYNELCDEICTQCLNAVQ